MNTFRYAEEKDCNLILYFIKELAAYEKMLDEVVATVSSYSQRDTGYVKINLTKAEICAVDKGRFCGQKKRPHGGKKGS